MMLLSELGMSGWDFLSANWGSIAILLTAIGGGITAFGGVLGYGIRVCWAWVRDQLAMLVTDHRELVHTLKDQIPRQTETLGTLSEIVKESRDHGSDVIREVNATKQAAGELTYALEAMACKESAGDVQRYMARARQRLGLEAKKPAKDSDS